jgi:hypothetical protein
MDVAIAAGLFLCTPFAVASGEAVSGPGTLSARASVDISITVPRVMQMRLIAHPAVLEVTAEDVAAGKVTVSGPSVDLFVNDRLGYVVRAEIVNAAFAAVRIAGLPAPLVATGAATTAHMPSMVGRARPQPYPVSYELQLSSDAAPGRYSWPVALSLQQL